MWQKQLLCRFFFLIFFCSFSQEAVGFGTSVLFAFVDRGCFLLCSGSSCLSSGDLVSPVYSQESVPSFIRLRVYKVSQYVGFFLFHKKNPNPKQPSNLNLSLISQVSFLHPLSWERMWVGKAVFWWWSILKLEILLQECPLYFFFFHPCLNDTRR